MGKGLGVKTLSAFSAVHTDVYRHLMHLPLLSYSLFVPRRAPVRAAKATCFRPVILVHGLGGSRGDLLPMEYYLRLFGRKQTYRIDLSKKRSIKDMSRALAKFVERVLRVNQCEKVDLVGYSMGGIISRLAIEDHALGSAVHSLITLGTPHLGTVSAKFSDTPLSRSLRPDSPIIQRLKDLPWPEGVRGVSFWSRNDLLVLPSQTAAAAGTVQIDVSPFTHFSYLIDPRSWSHVRAALDGVSIG